MTKITGINCMISDKENVPSTIKSVPVPGGGEGPQGKLLCWYGTRDSLTALKNVRLSAKKYDKILYRVEFVISGGEVPAGKTDEENIKQTYFLNLGRLKASLKDDIHKIIEDAEKKKIPDNIDTMDYVFEKPSRIKHIWDNPLFKHVKAVVWPAPIPGTKRKLNTQQLMALDISKEYDLVIRNFEGDTSEILIDPSLPLSFYEPT